MNRSTKLLALGAVVGALALPMLAGCADRNLMAEAAFRGPNARYDEDGNLYRLYDYFPEAQVYYSPFMDTWFWPESPSKWESGAMLPQQFAANLQNPTVLELPTSRPFEFHTDTCEAYPSLTELRAQVAGIETDF